MDHDRQRYALHAAVFAALSNPTRHELMHLLCKQPRTPCELAEALEVSRPNVSQHLALLQREGLVRRSRQTGRPRQAADGACASAQGPDTAQSPDARPLTQAGTGRRVGRVVWEVVDPRLSQACELIDAILAPHMARKAQLLERPAPAD
jgi:DNA-binding transcriptional ArsR family regulator